jgi:hypothetical protein
MSDPGILPVANDGMDALGKVVEVNRRVQELLDPEP